MTDREVQDASSEREASFYFFLVTSLVVVYTAAYLGSPDLPGNTLEAPLGWWAWPEQSGYRAAAEALVAGDRLDEPPFGYPLLGAIFSKWMPAHPFFVPNLLCSVGSAVLFYEIARRFVSRREAVLVLALVMVLVATELRVSLLVPWPSIPTLFLAYAMIVVFLRPSTSAGRVALLALLDGLVLLFQPQDALVLCPLVVVAALRVEAPRERRRAMAVAVAVLGLSVGASALLARSLTGSWQLPDLLPPLEGFSIGHLAVTAYLTFLDGIPIFRSQDPALLERMPWMLLAIPGLVYGLQRVGRQGWVVLGSVVLGVLVALADPGTSPAVLYASGHVHALVWVLPLVGLVSYLTVRFAIRALDWRLTVFCVLVPLVAIWFVRLEEVESVGGRVQKSLVVDLGGRVGAGAYDLMLVQAALRPDRAMMVDGRLLSLGRDFDLRRSYPHGTVPMGTMIYLWRPTVPDTVRFLDPKVGERQVEFRKLRWSFSPLPPMVMKRFHGRGWGADPLTLDLRRTATQLEAGVGVLDSSADVVRSTGVAGTLATTPPAPLLPGDYQIDLLGTVTRPGAVWVEVVARGGARRITRKRVRRVRVTKTPWIEQVEFRVKHAAADVQVRVQVDENVELQLRRIDISYLWTGE
ncbi:MAG: hypothetical protein JRI25_18995 [Deltaproteobacteria bacterium]|nr:hypothetical protein [Deltaproteobacteria bacterium]